MDIQALTQQQQNDFLASLFPSGDAQHNDSYHNTMRSQGGRSNGSPASSSSSSALHDGHGGSTLMESSSANLRSTNNSTSNPGHVGSGHNSGANTMFPPSSPIQPQSPNSQLTMQLLGNLMQMQGNLDNNFAHQNATAYSNQHPGGTSNFGHGFGGVSSNPGRGANLPISGGNPAYTNTAILEQQLKLQQLQQLQQLQNQIFQQQIALISSQSPPIPPTSPNTFTQPSQSEGHSNAATSPNFTGLATPGPSSELRPQQPHIDFDHFSQPLPSPMSSQNPHHSFSHHSNDFLHRGASSAPEHIAFHIRTGPTPSPHFSGGTRREFDLDISPLNSPWIGPQHGGGSSHSGEHDRGHDRSSHRLPEQRLPSNKRGAPSNGDESSHSRKKHSSALPSVTEDVTQAGSSGGMLMNPSSSGRRSYHKGSKSTTSTPLLRSSRSRSKSGAGNAFATSPLTTSSGSSGHNVDIHGTSYAGQGGSGANSTHSLPSNPIDTPSPVDLSMPPPPAPATVPNDPNLQSEDDGSGGFAFGNGGGSGSSSSNPGPQLTPLTPGVIMKLGPFGQSTGTATPTPASMPAPSVAPASAAPAPSSKSTAKSKAKSESGGKKAAASAGGLKPILPVGGVHASPAGPSASMDASTGPPKKVSHKDAEQKRRDSQKTAYDELRRLLPPITFEDDQDEAGGGGHAVMSKKKDEVIPVRGPLPPGALPPRGPPKAGGEGPNKGVSKLQLLICGNQYIRTLKGRVERRDGEIANLRREVARLRRKNAALEGKLERMKGMGLDEVGMEVDGFDLDHDYEEVEIDLERDLDAVEGMGVHVGLPGAYDDEGDE